ncbi:MAG: PEGA domain-containing protein [Alistipes sp.]|nr:PEGA domain-containing protein [Alistipes sp.]
MKRLLLLFALLAAIFTATAQSEHSIIIDQSSFRAIHNDALTGVNIDPIGVDSSRRPCARIKVKINRMSREDIDKLEVKIHSNNELTKCKTAEYDNGLILEMSALSNTRFYFLHPEFGYSNEVNINLEPNKEYYLEASLNQTYSIVVNSNVADAEVYLDSVFKGRTDNSNSLTIKGVFAGEHTLKLVYGSVSHEQKIVVNSGTISFRQNVNIAASEPQFVVFTVVPQSAVVIIDGKHYTLQDGAMRVVLDGGTYNYTVTAVGYHSKSGTFTVAGEKITKSISLTADVATVTLTAPNNAEIWINDEKKGIGSWSGRLTVGAYIFEAKKEGYKTATLSKHITSAQPQQSYTLPAPTPIYGSIMVDGNPINADVTLDGKPVGQLPLKLDEILIGNHTLKLSKNGYNTHTQTVTVTEGKTTTINTNLTKGYSPSSKSQKSTTDSVRGFEQHVAVNGDIILYDFNPSGYIIGATYTAGYRFNNYIFLGGGVGCSYYVEEIKIPSSYPDIKNGVTIPIYAKFRSYFTKTRWKPFFDVTLGADLQIYDLMSWHWDYSIESDSHGFYVDSGNNISYLSLHFNPAFGISCQINKKLEMFLSAGCRLFDYDQLALSINLGFAF